MSYYLEPGESFSRGIARIGAEQNDKALNALEEHQRLRKGIHKARKHFKKLRAIFRLIRDETGQGYYKPSNVFYRDRGRELAPLRDITSLIEAVAALEGQFGNQVKKATFSNLRELLEAERESAREELVQEGDRLEEVVEELRRARQWFVSVPVSDDCLADTVKSLRRVYKRGYQRFREAEEGGASPEQMHQWRKRVKYLWYHHRLLKQTWPVVYKAYAKAIKRLSDLLGDHHDFALLEKKIADLSENLSRDTCRVLRALCRQEQQRLEEEAVALGRRVYAESPDAFARRQRQWMKAGPFQEKVQNPAC